jgi:branched-chain amino acid transport system substrate-binding protein
MTAVFAVCAALAAAVVSGCGSSSDSSTSASTGSSGASTSSSTTSADSGKPIVIGVASGTTGPISFFDAPALEGAKLAVADINAAGGIDGRQLKIVTADHKSDTTQIVPAALKVLENGADVVLGSCDYDFANPAARTAQAKGKLALACAGSPVFGKQGVGPLAFNAYAGTPTEGAVMAQFAMNKGWKTAYALEDQGLEYSKTTCKYFREAYEQLGGKIVGYDVFKNDDPSIASQVTKLKAANPSFVALCSYTPGGASAVKQIRDAGVNAPIIGGGAFDGTYWLKGIPNLKDFYNPSFGTVGNEKDPDRAKLFADYKKATGSDPVSATYPIMGYTMVQMVADAIQKAGGKTDGPDLAKALESFKDVKTLGGLMTFTADCHVSLGRPLLINEIQNGKDVMVDEIKPTAVPKSPC